MTVDTPLTFESGDTCPQCYRGRLTAARHEQAYRLVCPRCCHSEQ